MNHSLTLLAILSLSVCPEATEMAERSPATISGTIQKEAARLARVEPPPAHDQSQLPQEARWARVRFTKPGAEILLTTHDRPTGRRYFLNADATTLHVLDLSSVSLHRDEFERLLAMASARPLRLVAAGAGEHVTDGEIAFQSGLATYGNRQIASIDQLIARVPVADVTEVVVVSSPRHLSAGTSALIGAIAGGVIGGLIFAPGKGAQDNFAGLGVMLFAPIGAGAGAFVYYLTEPNCKRCVVYQEP
jgi:hypothetical protein